MQDGTFSLSKNSVPVSLLKSWNNIRVVYHKKNDWLITLSTLSIIKPYFKFTIVYGITKIFTCYVSY